MKKRKITDTLLGLIVPAVIVLMWWYVTTFKNIPNTILPSLPDVGKRFSVLLGSGKLADDLKISLLRVLKGYLVSAVLGISLGTVIGISETIQKLLQPILTVIRQIPIMAWIPLLILWCGIGEGSKIVVIVLASFFPIMVNTQAGISSTPLEFVEVARLYRQSKIKTFLRVYLPHALPHIQTGLKLGLGVSWMAVVAAELIAATSGIGYSMSYARTLMQSDTVIIDMLIIGLVGIMMDKIVTVIFNSLTPWEKKKRERN
ncbi:MAG: ABC transporter permease [Oscillospiraceae bacterium]